jgi:hypothetical protein
MDWHDHLSAWSFFQPSGSWRVGSYQESTVAGPGRDLGWLRCRLRLDHHELFVGIRNDDPVLSQISQEGIEVILHPSSCCTSQERQPLYYQLSILRFIEQQEITRIQTSMRYFVANLA